MLKYLGIIPLLPLIGALLNGLIGLYTNRALGRKPNKTLVHTIAVGVVAIACLLSLGVINDLRSLPQEERVYETVAFNWIPATPIKLTNGALVNFKVDWGYRLDPLSAVMIFVVTFIGTLIHIYSTGYMHEESGYWRFFTYLNLFMFAMLTLVLGSSFLVLFVGWEGVGLCSYLLIGYYFEKKSAGDAGKKAFVVNRIGDAGFVIAAMLIVVTFGSLNFEEVFKGASVLPVEEHWGILTAITLFLFLGATGKSAQIPLYVWLPDAMEGPTPVSALIHAATMVTAGVYMVVRCNALFSRAPHTLAIVAGIGVATAIFAATIGFFQRDIKRVLAYSTVSQLGYMFTACGVGAFAAGLFHVYTHAFFKALLFLGSGSVIMGMHHEQDMAKMGGLRKYMPVTFGTMMIGTLAIAGTPLLSGFFSKDEILWRAFSGGHTVVWGIAFVAAGCTAFYMFRMIFLTFFGEPRFASHGDGGEHRKHSHGHGAETAHGTHAHDEPHDAHDRGHTPHESPKSMVIPLVILAIGSVVAGYVGMPSYITSHNLWEEWLHPVFRYQADMAAHGGEHADHGTEILMTALSVLIAAAGFLTAAWIYGKRRAQPADEERTLGGLYKLLYNKYYIDQIYDALFVHRTKNLGTGLWAFDRTVIDGVGVNGSGWLTRTLGTLSGVFDHYVVDGAVNLLAWISGRFSYGFRRLQTGLVQSYAMVIVVGVLAFFGLYIYFAK